ncbi:hypothetical protein BC831DRAFT_395327 [Entophlyctis helioformis]|nr:hypothetical protein BC831DRAFT_395327 [Entophlyctis helioformis]
MQPATIVAGHLTQHHATTAVLHSILFHRHLTTTRPVEADLDALELTYTCLQISVSFYERRPRKSWFTKADEDVCWEEWSLLIALTQATTEQQQLQAQTQLAKDVAETLMAIAREANEKKDHIPPMLSNDPFPFQITVTAQPTGLWGVIANTMRR